MKSIQKIQVIINPAAGQDEPILNTLNQVFSKYEIEWETAVTHDAGDAQRLTEEAIAAGVDLVAGYGGDGTLREIANGLRDSDVPLGILPGGTGNGLARELGIPLDLTQAAELLCRAPAVRQLDAGQIGDHYFLLHVYTGVAPDHLASRESKDNWGILAYLLRALQAITTPQVNHYSLTIDGKEIEQEGIICFITNALGLGLNLSFAKAIDPEDGLLNLILVKKAALQALPNPLEFKMTDELFEHWHGREISVRTEAPQAVWMDGDAGGETPFTAVAIPKALQIIVPHQQTRDV